MRQVTSLRYVLISVLGLLFLMALGCRADEQVAPAPPQPTDTPAQIAGIHIPNLAHGQETWNQQQCDACHGPLGLGGIGPSLAATQLSYDDFLHVVRTAVPPKPAYTAAMLPDDDAYDIYAWLRTQQPPLPVVPTMTLPQADEPSAEEIMGMTIWTCRSCDSCHGVFGQGGPEAPALAELSYPMTEELDRMRQTAAQVPEHSVDHISDEVFERLYKWLQAGCTYTDDCAQ